MSSLSRCALALTVALAACIDRLPVPPQASGQYDGIAASEQVAPSNLRVSFTGGEAIELSWYYAGDPNAIGGFLVERAHEEEGPWAIKSFTRDSRIADELSADERSCYRVVAVKSDPARNSAPSRMLCVMLPAPRDP